MIFNKKENVARGTAGLVFDVICDCGHAWSGLRKKYYTTSNNTLDFTFNSLVDFDNYIIYPTLIITSLGNGNISIKNNTTNELISFTGCSTNEIIILECSTDKCKTSFGNSIVSRWNKQTVGIVENINQFTLTGSFKVEFQYRLPIRVGA
jgi:phage-related protein